MQELILQPTVVANRAALEAISQADQIVLGPGSLYTSVLSCLAVPGVSEAIDESRAELVYVLNLTTQDGETWGMTGEDHLATLLAFAELQRGGVVLAHDRQIKVDEVDGVDGLEIDEGEAAELGWKVRLEDLVNYEIDWPEHDTSKLTAALASLA